ncbi:hypothetical protein [Nocardia suismassiliense]|uniref:hypothetical protein n=1 Tax=Nocardia suismassiliense TaxID=2077092 RepID=UPI000D1EE2D3|nr:hypothetical protein [Nocardia suismassiliense]
MPIDNRDAVLRDPQILVLPLVEAREIFEATGKSWPPPEARTAFREVTVRDRRAEPWWAGLFRQPRAVATVLIQQECQHPGCHTPRGDLFWDGPVQVWTNPCGHVDRPEHMIIESLLLEIAYANQLLTEDGTAR